MAEHFCLLINLWAEGREIERPSRLVKTKEALKLEKIILSLESRTPMLETKKSAVTGGLLHFWKWDAEVSKAGNRNRPEISKNAWKLCSRSWKFENLTIDYIGDFKTDEGRLSIFIIPPSIRS